jgi:hypothetical protein
MADSKISALPASTVPLAGTEVLPIVQSSTTRQVSVANLTAGRAISATQITLTTGNVIVANGQGIDFSATPGTGTSELLADYEEGTWTPVVAFGGASVAITGTFIGKYTKIGRQVFGYCQLQFTNKGSSTGAMTVTGLPFTSTTAATYACPAGYVASLTLAVQFQAWINENSATITVQKMNLTATADVLDSDISNSTRVDFSFSYLT